MRLGDFEMEIIGGTETPDGYVALSHGQKYAVRIVNHGKVPCDARMLVDGTEVGLFRIPPRSRSDIERPTDDNGQFTFFKVATPEARAARITKTEETGLVQTVFMPAKSLSDLSPVLFSSPSPSHLNAGGTGLSGRSSQEFTPASRIDYASPDKFVTITLRLGCGRPESIRPLPNRHLSNPVPPPL